jgi:hypothetical protein
MEEANGVVWESPPNARRKYQRHRYLDSIRALCLAPGNWARIDTFHEAKHANSTRSNLKNAMSTKRYKLPEEAQAFEVELTVRKLTDNEWGLFARAINKEGA